MTTTFVTSLPHPSVRPESSLRYCPRIRLEYFTLGCILLQLCINFYDLLALDPLPSSSVPHLHVVAARLLRCLDTYSAPSVFCYQRAREKDARILYREAVAE